MGAWIEIEDISGYMRMYKVAPFVGAWIEIHVSICAPLSVPVAPFVGAWIEMISCCTLSTHDSSRSLRGSVD